MHKPTTHTPDKSPVTLQPEAQPPKTAKPSPPSYQEERDALMRKEAAAGQHQESSPTPRQDTRKTVVPIKREPKKT